MPEDAPIRLNSKVLRVRTRGDEYEETYLVTGLESTKGWDPWDALKAPGIPDRYTNPLEDPVILEIATAHHVHSAAICLKWAVQRGQTPIPLSTQRHHYLANLRAVVEDPLTLAEMQALQGLDRNCRLVKGQVFLWKSGQSWEDLWDPNGTITPP